MLFSSKNSLTRFEKADASTKLTNVPTSDTSAILRDAQMEKLQVPDKHPAYDFLKPWYASQPYSPFFSRIMYKNLTCVVFMTIKKIYIYIHTSLRSIRSRTHNQPIQWAGPMLIIPDAKQNTRTKEYVRLQQKQVKSLSYVNEKAPEKGLRPPEVHELWTPRAIQVLANRAA